MYTLEQCQQSLKVDFFLLKQLLETCSKYNLDRGAVDPSDRGPRGWNNPHIDLVARMLTQIVNTHLYFINL